MGQGHILKYTLGIFVATVLVFGCGSDDDNPPPVPGKPSSAYPATGWPVIHHDSRNTDASDTPGPDDVTLAFEGVLVGRTIAAGATVGREGNVYVGTGLGPTAGPDRSCHLFALDGKNGEQLWCSDKVNDRAITSSPWMRKPGRSSGPLISDFRPLELHRPRVPTSSYPREG